MHFWPRYPQAGSATGGFPEIHSTFTTNVNSYINNAFRFLFFHFQLRNEINKDVYRVFG